MSENFWLALSQLDTTEPPATLYWAAVDGNQVTDINAGTELPVNAVEITQEQYNTIRVAYAVHNNGRIYERAPTTFTANRLKKLDNQADSVYTVYKDFPWMVCTSTAPADYYTITDE